MSAATVLLSLFKYKAWANVELFAEVAKLDAQAHQTERHTAIRLLNHIYVVDRIFAAHLSGASHGYQATNTAETPSLDELREAVFASDQWYVDFVAALTPAALAETRQFRFTDGDDGQMSREEMLLHVATHGGYHRGAVGRVISQASLPPPRDLYTRYLHIAEPERRRR